MNSFREFRSRNDESISLSIDPLNDFTAVESIRRDDEFAGAFCRPYNGRNRAIMARQRIPGIESVLSVVPGRPNAISIVSPAQRS